MACLGGEGVRFYKEVSDGYIMSIGVGTGSTEITEQEYNAIRSVIANKPEETETTDYMLRDDLTWEAYEVESIPEPDPTPDEALDFLFGGES